MTEQEKKDKQDYEDYVAYQAYLDAQTPKPGEGEDTGGLPNFGDIAKGVVSGALNEASFNYVPANLFPNKSPTATNVGRVLGGLMSGAAIGKAVSKIPGLARFLYSEPVYDAAKFKTIPVSGGQKVLDAGKRIAANTALGALVGAGRNPHEGESRLDNALNDAMFGTGLSTTGEVLQSIPSFARYLGRKIGGLNPQEAEAFRMNPAKSEKLFRMNTEGDADKVNSMIQTMFRGSYAPGVKQGGGLQSRLQAGVIDPAKAAKAAELNQVVGNFDIGANQTLGLSPEVQGALPSMSMSTPNKIVLTPQQASQVQTAAANSAYARARASRANPIAYPYDPSKDADLALANDLRSKMQQKAPAVYEQNRIMEDAINMKDTMDDRGSTIGSILTADGQNEAIRSYYDRNTGSRLNTIANQLEAGKKLYGDRQMSMMNVPSLLSLVGGQPVARTLIRTPMLPKGATGMTALQAILGATRPIPSDTFGD